MRMDKKKIKNDSESTFDGRKSTKKREKWKLRSTVKMCTTHIHRTSQDSVVNVRTVVMS